MSFHKRIIGVLMLTLFGVGLNLYAQPAQLDFRHFDTDDGLPSSEIYAAIQDAEGYIWLGTDNGLARFDGYEFVVYDVDDGLEDAVVFSILIDNEDRLWASTLSGRVFYLEDDRFFPYAFNAELNATRKTGALVHLLDVTPDGSLVFRHSGIFTINSVGKVEKLTENDRGHLYAYESVQGEFTEHRIIASNYALLRSLDSKDSTLVSTYTEGRWQDVGRLLFQSNRYISIPYFTAIEREGEKQEVIVVHANLIYSIKHGKTRVIGVPGEDVVINFVIPSSIENEYWAFLAHGGGLRYYTYDPETKSTKYLNYFKKHSLSSGFFDRKGGLWVTSLDAGLFYVPAPPQRVYTKVNQLENAKPTCVAGFGTGSFYAGYDDGSVFVYHEGDERLYLVSRIDNGFSGRVADLYFDTKAERLYSSYNDFDHLSSKENEYRLPPNSPSVREYRNPYGNALNYRKLNRSKFITSRKLYISSKSELKVVDLDSFKSDTLAVDHGQRLDIQVLGVDWDGNFQMGTVHGLFTRTPEGEWKKMNADIPALNGRVVDIQNLPGGAMLYGTRGSGLVFLNQDTSFLIREKDGLASDMVRNLDQDDDGNIWVSTLTGFSKVTFDGVVPSVRTFRMEHGLPSNEVYRSNTFGGEIWLATSAGIVKFTEPALDSISPAPEIRSVVINGVKQMSVSGFELPAGKQDVSISFSTINFIQAGSIEYRYRFADGSPWRYTRARLADFPNLGAGYYDFQVESKNPDGYWSGPTHLSFSIATPWYDTWGVRFGGVFLLLMGVVSFFLLRERRRKREQDLLLQITQMEHAALHAQMNPHFVFNALNSIQNFVLENDARQAATYLSRFARVIRQTLRSSVDGQHRLNEELMMLETYLGLEKLRFKQGFSYTVEVDPALPKDAVILPPLLIQPFVENAIIHGLKDRKKGGRILLRFTGTAENLVVIIEDNGKGYDPGEEAKPDSLGMNITRRRLDMMNQGKDGVSGMEIIPLFSHDGTPVGTRVTLFIRPLTDAAPAVAP